MKTGHTFISRSAIVAAAAVSMLITASAQGTTASTEIAKLIVQVADADHAATDNCQKVAIYRRMTDRFGVFVRRAIV